MDADEVRVHRASAEYALGGALDDPEDAGRWYHSARHLFAEVGAASFTRHCEAVLGVGGPRQLLTDGEREVAELVVAGLTNRQTAERLHVSEKTVEYHLRKVYAKLDVPSRGKLRARMDVAGGPVSGG